MARVRFIFIVGSLDKGGTMLYYTFLIFLKPSDFF